MERDPAAVLQAAIRGVVERLPETLKEEKEETFQPARYFVGSKRGYYFSTGDQGTGYYLDPIAVSAKVEDGKRVLDPEELLQEAEEQANISEIQLVDAKSLRRYVTAFDRKYKENQEMRMKYSNQPEKFMDSEVDLDEEVQRLLAVAASPELYPDFVRTGVVEHLMALVGHENTDIAADVLELFNQLTDADVIEDSEEEARVLVESMVEHNGLELLVHRLTSLVENSDDEQKAVFNTLAIFENMIEVKPEVAEWVLERTKLLKWLLTRLRPREFDSNKQYASELLAILVQNSTKNQQSLADMNGIDALLQAIAPYKNRNPGSVDEEEHVENLFNCLCACLISAETRNLFHKAEGTELMMLILKAKRLARAGALKALNFATTRSPANCERFIDNNGLKTIFAMFMGKIKLKRKKAESDEADEEERALSVIANLFQGLPRGSRRDRLAAKFVESEFEKCDRLIELLDRYQKRVQKAEAEAKVEDEVDDEAQLLASLEAGTFCLQQCSLIIGHLWFVGDLGVRKRILQLLHQKGHSLTDVRKALLDFKESIGDEGNKAETEKECKRVQRLLQGLGMAEEPAVVATPAPAQPPQQDPKPEVEPDVPEPKAELAGQEPPQAPATPADAAPASEPSSREPTPPPPAVSNEHLESENANGRVKKEDPQSDSDREDRRRGKDRERPRTNDRNRDRDRRHEDRPSEKHRQREDRREDRYREEKQSRHKRSEREDKRERKDSHKRHRDYYDDDRRDRKRDRR